MKNKDKAISGTSGNALEVIKMVIIAVLISLVMVLISAFVIKMFDINNEYIPIISQVIKSVSILISCLLVFKMPHNGWIKGGIGGILYILIAYVVFSLISKNFALDIKLLNDCVLGCVTGIISGIIAVNLKKHF